MDQLWTAFEKPCCDWAGNRKSSKSRSPSLEVGKEVDQLDFWNGLAQVLWTSYASSLRNLAVTGREIGNLQDGSEFIKDSVGGKNQ